MRRRDIWSVRAPRAVKSLRALSSSSTRNAQPPFTVATVFGTATYSTFCDVRQVLARPVEDEEEEIFTGVRVGGASSDVHRWTGLLIGFVRRVSNV